MTDLRAFTQDLAQQMKADLGTRLDWVAVDHGNTNSSHVHMQVRGVDQNGEDLVTRTATEAPSVANLPRRRRQRRR
jgi:type IV secretory pathway VirD2 relaxase